MTEPEGDGQGMRELICDRAFDYEDDGTGRRVVVEWMKPVRDRGAWRCDWIIHWFLRDADQGYAVGEDSTQALLLAMKLVRSHLEHEAENVSWLEDRSLGLPSLYT